MSKRALVALGTRYGASPTAKEKMKQVDAEAHWTATCRHCRAELYGTLAQLRRHVCTEKVDG